MRSKGYSMQIDANPMGYFIPQKDIYSHTQDEEESMLKGHAHVVKTFFTHIYLFIS